MGGRHGGWPRGRIRRFSRKRSGSQAHRRRTRLRLWPRRIAGRQRVLRARAARRQRNWRRRAVQAPRRVGIRHGEYQLGRRAGN